MNVGNRTELPMVPYDERQEAMNRLVGYLHAVLDYGEITTRGRKVRLTISRGQYEDLVALVNRASVNSIEPLSVRHG